MCTSPVSVGETRLEVDGRDGIESARVWVESGRWRGGMVLVSERCEGFDMLNDARLGAVKVDVVSLLWDRGGVRGSAPNNDCAQLFIEPRLGGGGVIGGDGKFDTKMPSSQYTAPIIKP